MSDLSSLSAIQGWVSSLQSTMGGLGSDFQQAAATGDFASVLAEAQGVLSGYSSPAATSSGTSSATSATSTATSATPTPTSAASTATSAGMGAAGTAAAGLLGGVAGGVSSTTSASTVAATAEKYLGVPYLWGGTSPSGFDCSGFTQYVYGQLGVSLPRTAAEQATAGVAVPSLADAQPGDLVFFPGSDGTAASPGHVGIYLGNGEMIDAPQTGETVSVQPVGDPVAIRRVLPAVTDAPESGAPESGAPESGAPESGAPVSGTPVSGAPVSGTSAAPESSLQVPSSLAPLFQSAASQYGVPASLLAAVAQVESGYDAGAVSDKGAEGLMQLLPSTAAGLGVDPFDPGQAIDGAARLLSGYLAQYHSPALALAAYNAGPAAVAQYGGVPPYAETQAYVPTVLGLAGEAA